MAEGKIMGKERSSLRPFLWASQAEGHEHFLGSSKGVCLKFKLNIHRYVEYSEFGRNDHILRK